MHDAFIVKAIANYSAFYALPKYYQHPLDKKCLNQIAIEVLNKQKTGQKEVAAMREN